MGVCSGVLVVVLRGLCLSLVEFGSSLGVGVLAGCCCSVPVCGVRLQVSMGGLYGGPKSIVGWACVSHSRKWGSRLFFSPAPRAGGSRLFPSAGAGVLEQQKWCRMVMESWWSC